MKIRITILILVISMIGLFGCSDDVDYADTLTGSKWSVTMAGATMVRQFNEDGTISEWVNDVIRTDGTYSIDGNVISATMTTFVNEETGESTYLPEETNWRWSYSIKGNKLTLTDLENADNADLVYTRS